MKNIVYFFGLLMIMIDFEARGQMPDGTTQIIVKFKKEILAGNRKQSFVKQIGHRKIDEINNVRAASVKQLSVGRRVRQNIFLIRVPKKADVEKLIAEYFLNDLIEYAEPDNLVSSDDLLDVSPDDQYYFRQWGLKNDGSFALAPALAGADIEMEKAWGLQQGSNGVVVAVVDTGIKLDHNEFSGRVWTNLVEISNNGIDDDANGYIDDLQGWDFINSDNTPSDDDGHGTNVASIIGANGNNSIGFAGIDWNCKLMALKVLDQNGSGLVSALISSIYYAVDNGAKVINMSLSSAAYSQALQDAINYALNQNVVLVASMGNSNSSVVRYPAGNTGVIAVGATNPNDTRVNLGSNSGSSFGNHISVVAPGRYIYGLNYLSNTNYNVAYTGTSQSAPHVSGIVSLLFAQNINRTHSEIKNIIENSAEDLVGDSNEDFPGWDQYFGFGRVNCFNALTLAINNFLPSQTITSPANNATVSYDINDRFEVITTPNTATDSDGDNLTKTIQVFKVSNNSLIKTVTTANNNQVFILKTELEPHTAYTIRATLTDGIGTTSLVSSNFSTPNALPTQTIAAPANNATVSYDINDRFEVITTPNTATDSDGDNLSKTIQVFKVSNNSLIKTVTTANNNQVFILKTELEPHTAYTIRATLTDGIGTTSLVSSNFSTPNALPTQTIAAPANNATVSYDINDRFEVITTPNTATDSDGDNLTKTIQVFKVSNNALIKTVTTANNNQVFILKTELEPHTAYTIRATLTDGIGTTSLVSSNFSTPNALPTQTIAAPANTATVSYDINDRFEVITTPNTATDSDGDNLSKTIQVFKVSNNALIKTVTTANNNQVFILKTELEPHTAYTIRATLTDGIGTTSLVSSNFSTPNILPTQTITSPANYATVSYDANDHFEIITTPIMAIDSDGDNLVKTIHIFKISNNSLIKTVTTANDNQVFILKTELESHTAYTIEASLTDGIEMTGIVNSNFFTPATPINSLPTQTIAAPSNNASVSYDINDRFEVITTPNTATDSDGDNLSKTIQVFKVSNNSLIKTVTTANNNQVFILKTELEPHTAYTIRATLTDGIGTTSLVSSNFSTPNALPTQTIAAPANNATVSYDINDRFEVITTPKTATDSDGDNLTKTIQVFRVSNNALIKTMTTANNNQVFILKTELEPHTAYTIRATLTDGIGTTSLVSSNFSTPNTLPVFSIVSPSNGQVIVYTNKEIDIVTNPTVGKDEDNDELTKNIRVIGPGLDTLISQSNTTRVFLKETRLQTNSSYTIELSGTDGIVTSPSVNTTFKTPVIVGIMPVAEGFKVYPNPFNNQLCLGFTGQFEVEILNNLGQEMFRSTVINNDCFQFNFPVGLYLLIMRAGESKITTRIVKN